MNKYEEKLWMNSPESILIGLEEKKEPAKGSEE